MSNSKNTQKPVFIKSFESWQTQECQLGKCYWNVARLVALVKDLPVIEIPMQHLNVYNLYENLTIRDFVKHMDAVMNADLNFPIILDEDGEIMDGRHRVIKALYQRKTKIKAVRFDVNPTPCRRADD